MWGKKRQLRRRHLNFIILLLQTLFFLKRSGKCDMYWDAKNFPLFFFFLADTPCGNSHHIFFMGDSEARVFFWVKSNASLFSHRWYWRASARIDNTIFDGWMVNDDDENRRSTHTFLPSLSINAIRRMKLEVWLSSREGETGEIEKERGLNKSESGEVEGARWEGSECFQFIYWFFDDDKNAECGVYCACLQMGEKKSMDYDDWIWSLNMMNWRNRISTLNSYCIMTQDMLLN